MHNFVEHHVSLLSPLSDPEMWFLKDEYYMVTKTRDEGTVPCLVTDPRINVTLHERETDSLVRGEYLSTVGYTALLEDNTYRCRGELNGEEKWSNPYHVFSIIGM